MAMEVVQYLMYHDMPHPINPLGQAWAASLCTSDVGKNSPSNYLVLTVLSRSVNLAHRGFHRHYLSQWNCTQRMSLQASRSANLFIRAQYVIFIIRP